MVMRRLVSSSSLSPKPFWEGSPQRKTMLLRLGKCDIDIPSESFLGCIRQDISGGFQGAEAPRFAGQHQSGAASGDTT